MIGNQGGWTPDNGRWVEECVRYIEQWNGAGNQGVAGVVFYRWDFDVWKLRGKAPILNAIGAAARRLTP
jgi:hypothetical protein